MFFIFDQRASGQEHIHESKLRYFLIQCSVSCREQMVPRASRFESRGRFSRVLFDYINFKASLSLSLSLSLFFVRCLSLFRTHERTRNEISITCNIITRRDRSNIEIVDEKRARFVPTVVRSGRFADAFELIGERAIKFFNKSRAKFASNEFH